MDSEWEVRCLAAVWAMRAILTPEGFEKYSLKDGENFWAYDDLKELLNNLKHEHLPNVLRLLALNSLEAAKNELNLIPLRRQGHFFVNLRKLENLLGLSEGEREVLLFALLVNEERGLRSVVNEFFEEYHVGPQGLYGQLSKIIKIPPREIRWALRKDGNLCTSGLIEFDQYGRQRISWDIKPLEGLYDALLKPGTEVEDLLSPYFSRSPAPRLHPKDFSHHPDLKILLGYLRTALETGEKGNNVLIYGPPGTGKTELVRSLGHHLKASLYEVSSEDEDGQPTEEDRRFRSYLLCQQIVAKKPRGLILFDEIEDVFPLPIAFFFGRLRNSSHHKGWTNRILETNEVPTF